MALGSSSSNVPVVPNAKRALNQFKYEVANELGIQIPEDGYWGTMATRDVGAIGGNMVRKMIAMAEQSLANQGGGQPPQQ